VELVENTVVEVEVDVSTKSLLYLLVMVVLEEDVGLVVVEAELAWPRQLGMVMVELVELVLLQVVYRPCLLMLECPEDRAEAEVEELAPIQVVVLLGLVAQLLQVFLPSKPIKVMEQEVMAKMVVLVQPQPAVQAAKAVTAAEQQVFV
jgi:hypothetical protein